jgi:ornithine cyclodeaminase/alanine dehydrogenase-like protein (mu-crystallin family)
MTMQVRLLNEKHIQSVVPTLVEIVALVEEAYRLDAEGKAEVPTKIGVHPDRANTFLHAMPAWVGGTRALGMKWVSYFPGNFDRGLPDSTGLIILNHPDHGMPCCIMEGMYVTFLRTAACAAIAAKYVVPRPPKTLGLVGCGGLGRWSLRILTTVFPSIEKVFVSSRTPQTREAFCAEMAGEGRWSIAPVEDPLDAVRDIDIVVSSIPPTESKPITGDAFSAGTTYIPLDLVNAWRDDVLSAATRVVADNPPHFAKQVRARSVDTFPALLNAEKSQDLVAGRAQRSSLSDRNVVAVCGIASTDVVVGWEIYRRACAQKVGFEFDMIG